MSSNFGSVPKLLFSVDARKPFLLKALLSSRSGDDCCVIRPLVRGLWLNTLKSSTVIKIIDTWFHGAGFQQYIFLDSGPQFGAAKFKNYCKEHYITPLVSSACFPQSNDLAEIAVTSAKYLLLKSENYTDFENKLYYMQNIPSSGDTLSPAEKFFKHRIRTHLPTLDPFFNPVQMHEGGRKRFKIGDRVRIQKMQFQNVGTILGQSAKFETAVYIIMLIEILAEIQFFAITFF
jgi:hypothetical protein